MGLEQENKRLEVVAEALQISLEQYSKVPNQREAFDKEARKYMDQTVHVMTNMVKMQYQSHHKMQTVKKHGGTAKVEGNEDQIRDRELMENEEITPLHAGEIWYPKCFGVKILGI